MNGFRVGFGFDVHRLEEGQPFWLGGIKVPHTKGSIGHSDADTLIHAICDAMLGACALGDIGQHFPDNDPSLKGIDSKILLKKITALVAEQGYELVNVDATIALQKPKVATFIPDMRKSLADVIGVDVGQVSVKATTTEKLGFEGREEGVSAYAVVLLSKSNH
ncbi:MAG: 2-C-methyl-D-erythritol 2,4-cyclodiphosphate synthase [Flavobacteriales bacterium]|nr:2-C-methyl-D-erythritol 2,4-cyclodiphosphate synthase [Flavobacteriales bacterium]